MTVTWLLARKMSNYGVVDVVWSAGFGVVALMYWMIAAIHHQNSGLDGFSKWSVVRSGTLTLMVAVWSLRLAWHLGRRVARHHPREDVRYERLRVQWGDSSAVRMFWFYQLQGLLQAVLSTPFAFAVIQVETMGHRIPFGWAESAAIGLWLGAWVGESISDYQLSVFRANPLNRGKVCQEGLWGWSRHPNYFFEWLIWVSYWLFALPTPWGWISIVAPGLMLYFLLYVTGIPMTEALSVESKGDAYRDYQRRTSAFFPWPPRRGHTRDS